MTNKILCIIPARSGSKGVKNKNMRLVGGRSLIDRAIDSAQISNIEFDVCFTSDSEDFIENVRKSHPNVITVLRGHDLSDDNALTIDVIFHALDSLKNKGLLYTHVLLLQVTTPFRTSYHLNDALNYYLENNFDSLVSVVNVQGHHPFRMKRLENNLLINFIDQGFEDMRPRQSLPPVFLRNGAIYLTKINSLFKSKSLLSGAVGAYEMDEITSVNIDTEIDLKFAQLLALENGI